MSARGKACAHRTHDGQSDDRDHHGSHDDERSSHDDRGSHDGCGSHDDRDATHDAELRGKAYLARGKRGIAYTALMNGKTVLLKIANPEASVNTIRHEAEMLKLVNAKGIGPLFMEVRDGALIREFIDGPEMLDWIAGAEKPAIKRVLADVVRQCRQLDELGINKMEMTHPQKHILIVKNKPVFIDFDRARVVQRPKNVTQVCQWLTNKELSSALSAKGISLPREAILEHAKAYKRNYSRIPYEHIVEVIQNA